MINITVFGSGSSGNGYLLDDGYSQLIIEAGVQFNRVQNKMQHDFSRLDGVLISHEHRDHCKFIRPFIDFTGADVYATRGTVDAMFDDPMLKLKYTSGYRFQFLTYKVSQKIGPWYVTAFETKHDAKEPCGFLIDHESGDRLVFITDSYYVKYKFPNVTHMMVEANYDREIMERSMTDGYKKKLKTRIMESHFDFDNALKFIDANKSDKLKEIYLIHLSDANSNAEQFRKKVQALTGVPVYIA